MGRFDGFDEIRVFGHEAVARKDMCIAVLFRDLDDLGDALEFLFLADAHVIGHAMHIGRKAHVP